MKVMQSLERKILEVNPKDFIKRSAIAQDFSELVNYSAKIFSPDGELLVVYEANADAAPLRVARECLNAAKFTWNKRSNGMKTNSEIFGYAPRHGMRRQPCRLSAWQLTEQAAGKALMDAASFLDEWYERHTPESYRLHRETVSQVLPDWKIEDTVFTSGIANKNNQVDYHYDAGNFKDCRSIMIGFREKCRGGLLAVPQLNLLFEIGDNSIISFDGQSLIHGVTPMYISPGGFRYTVVYYSLRKMWDCSPIDEELIAFRKRMDATTVNPHWKRKERGDGE